MPANPSVIESIQAVRDAIFNAPGDRRKHNLPFAIQKLFRENEKIVGDRESLGAVLALAAEVEALRGKGSQFAVDEISQGTKFLVYDMKSRLPNSKISPELFPQEDELRVIAKDTDVVECFEMLADYVFARTQGPSVRSLRAGSLRAEAWDVLGSIAEILVRPEHLTHALKVAADKRASLRERYAGVSYLPEYWSGDEPDEATVGLLEELMGNPPDRDLLVTVMQARIELGLDDEFGALNAVDAWDDDHEEE